MWILIGVLILFLALALARTYKGIIRQDAMLRDAGQGKFKSVERLSADVLLVEDEKGLRKLIRISEPSND